MAENFGVRGRGVLYEELGAIRDVVQNHMLEVIALLTMEAPIGRDADAFRSEKLGRKAPLLTLKRNLGAV